MKTPQRVDVLFALTGDVRRNSRALRQLRLLGSAGLRTQIISFGNGGPPELDIPNTHLVQVPPTDMRGPLYFWTVHQMVREIAVATEARAYHASDLYVLPSMAAAAGLHRGRLIYDARELYAYVSSTVGRPWVRAFWRLIEHRYIRRATAVTTVSDGIADKLAEMYDIKRPSVVLNVPDQHRPTLRRSLRLSQDRSPSEIVILHQGQLRPDRGCDILVDAMRDVGQAILVFLGDGPLRASLEEQARDLKVAGRVRFVDAVEPDELLAYTASADIGVTLLEDTCLNHRLALPNKLFEYLTAGVPVLASDLPEIRKVVKDYEVGLLVDPTRRDDLVAGLNQAVLDKSLREQWRRNIPRALETFSWKAASEHFLEAYQPLLREVT